MVSGSRSGATETKGTKITETGIGTGTGVGSSRFRTGITLSGAKSGGSGFGYHFITKSILKYRGECNMIGCKNTKQWT